MQHLATPAPLTGIERDAFTLGSILSGVVGPAARTYPGDTRKAGLPGCPAFLVDCKPDDPVPFGAMLFRLQDTGEPPPYTGMDWRRSPSAREARAATHLAASLSPMRTHESAAEMLDTTRRTLHSWGKRGMDWLKWHGLLSVLSKAISECVAAPKTRTALVYPEFTFIAHGMTPGPIVRFVDGTDTRPALIDPRSVSVYAAVRFLDPLETYHVDPGPPGVVLRPRARSTWAPA